MLKPSGQRGIVANAADPEGVSRVVILMTSAQIRSEGGNPATVLGQHTQLRGEPVDHCHMVIVLDAIARKLAFERGDLIAFELLPSSSSWAPHFGDQ
jgi:hypothetical protein